MGQYFRVYNSTKRQFTDIGRFYGSKGEWEDLCFILGWDKSDDITAYGDEGDNFKLHDDSHKDASRAEWLFCLFVAKKFNEDPHKLYDEYLHDFADNYPDISGYKKLDYSEQAKW